MNIVRTKKRGKYPKPKKVIGSTDHLRRVGGRFIGSGVGIESGDFAPLTRMTVPSVQEALQCVFRMRLALGLSKVDLAAVLGFPRSTVASWFKGVRPPIAARLLLPRLEREIIGPQDDLAELFPPPTGSVQPAQDVILQSKPGHQA